MERFEIQPVLRSALPDVAAFLHSWRNNQTEFPPAQKPVHESVLSIERRLRWLLVDNPVAEEDSTVGYCLRDEPGVIRGLNLSYPVAFQSADTRLLGLCSGSFFVEPPARSLGFYLFKKYLRIPGYSFYFASTCNANSSELWRSIGGCPVPNSETEYIFPLRLDVMLPAFVASRTSNQVAASIARACGRGANPLVQFLTKRSTKLTIEPCSDWEKLSELSRRHRSPDYITSDRSSQFLEWRYGPGSPSHPCDIYLFRDELGQEGWFALGNLTRGEVGPFRQSVLLDTVWPRDKMSYSSIFPEILRAAASVSDVLSFRWQPGIDCTELSPFVIPHKLAAPRAFVSVPKGAAHFALDAMDYDDSDYVAWRFPWATG